MDTPATGRSDNRLGDFLRRLRTSRRQGQGEASQAAGIHRATLHRWESGASLPRLPELDAYLRAAGADARERRRAIALMDAPRSRSQSQAIIARIAERHDFAPMPHGGDLLRAIRLRAGFSREETASRLGVSERTLRRREDGEIWPAAPQLHEICCLLDATEEEIVTLTSGRFFLDGMATRYPPETLRERIWRTKEHIAETDLLTMTAEIWPLAARDDAGRRLLSEIYVWHAHFLSNRRRRSEAARYAERALYLGADALGAVSVYKYAALALADAMVYGGRRPAPERGLGYLRKWLPDTHEPDFRAWMLSCLGEYAALRGESEAAVALSGQACDIAQTSPNLSELTLRQIDRARRLLGAKRPHAALEALAAAEEATPRHRANSALMRVRIYLECGERSAAHDWLQRAERSIAEGDQDILYPEAAALALRF